MWSRLKRNRTPFNSFIPIVTITIQKTNTEFPRDIIKCIQIIHASFHIAPICMSNFAWTRTVMIILCFSYLLKFYSCAVYFLICAFLFKTPKQRLYFLFYFFVSNTQAKKTYVPLSKVHLIFKIIFNENYKTSQKHINNQQLLLY